MNIVAASAAIVSDDRLLRVPEVAGLLATSEGFVWGLIRQGVLPSVKIARCRRIPASALERAIREGLPARRADATPAVAER
jgi:excisionase family DNA binding protein